MELEGSPALEEIRKRGKLMVGLRSANPAFAIRKGPGEYGGFDVEIAKVIARGIGMNPETDIAYRWLPPSLLTDAMAAGNVDIQIGGFDPTTPKTAEVGPYIVTGDVRHFIGIQPGDDAMRAELQRILDAGISNGAWQRAYDSTLGKAGIEGTPR